MSERIRIDAADPGVNAYALLTALVVPRPIAWVSTVSADGVGNLAPHSFFTVVCHRPPMVAFTSVGVKDTLTNIRATGEFVVNVAGLSQIQAVNATSARLAPEVDEAVEVGIATEPSYVVRPPRVVRAPAALECRLHTTVELGGCVQVIGEVIAFAVRSEVMRDGRPTMAGLAPVSRLGGDEWGLPPDVVRLTRPR
ncbi:flavin reductase family protein [Nocardioides alcanivorans]|uniref:flavin reductase family protein n=1 Tax=Nocardioides alcanivorans TaxID=2897352 RepID=UPI001F27B32A|nr:flavin reductase family protein [Nocardioides alcanivorans]